MSTCEGIGGCWSERIDRIYSYLDGALEPEDLRVVETHISDCPECAAEHQLECGIRILLRRSCTEVAPPELKVAIYKRLTQP